MSNLIEQHHALTTEIDQFFSELPDPDESTRRFHQLMMIVLSSEETEGWTATQRSNAVFLVTRTCTFVENLHKIYEKSSIDNQKS